jgi:hypothetical protein
MTNSRQQSGNERDHDDGWGPMRRALRIVFGLLTAYAFYHGYQNPQFIYELSNGPTLPMRVICGLVIAFLPAMLFGLTFVRHWRLKSSELRGRL